MPAKLSLLTKGGRWLKKTMLGEKGFAPKEYYRAGKEFVTSPYTSVKKGIKSMSPGEGLLTGAIVGPEAIDSVSGQLGKGESRAERVGGTIGSTAAFLGLPFKRVGLLGSIGGSVLGELAGRTAGKVISKGHRAISGEAGKYASLRDFTRDFIRRNVDE
jgi:hypothetical protein